MTQLNNLCLKWHIIALVNIVHMSIPNMSQYSECYLFILVWQLKTLEPAGTGGHQCLSSTQHVRLVSIFEFQLLLSSTGLCEELTSTWPC